MKDHQVPHYNLNSSVSTSSYVDYCVSDISFKDDIPLEENIGDYNLDDIFQILSQVPLYATASSPPDIDHQLTQTYQFTEESKFKDIEVNKGDSNRKLLLETEQIKLPPHNNKGQLNHSSKGSMKRRTSEHKRRKRINSKIRAIQALLPNCDKRDQASILDHAIKHIKSLQLQINMMSRCIGQNHMLYSYKPQMMMQSSMFTKIGFGPWYPQMSPSANLYMVTPPNGVGV